MKINSQRPRVKDGVLYLAGQPVFHLSADYPYYRDHKRDWAMQLNKIKQMGVDHVTFYIPWRHHLPADPLRTKIKPDFKGLFQDNTDVLYLLDLCRRIGLQVVAKPGPFVHAELDFGGLPDYVEAGARSGIEPMTRANGSKITWGNLREQVLPAPLDPVYLAHLRLWLEAVTREVLVPWQYPAGPIVAIQILNEGIYSDANHKITAYDYSPSALAQWQKFLKEKYRSLSRLGQIYGQHYDDWSQVAAPREWQNVHRHEDLLRYIDWGEFSGKFIPLLIKEYRKYMPGIKVPFLTNCNPPGVGAQAQEAYFARNNVRELEPVANYGYTNWLGVIYNNWEDYCRYRLVAQRARGICLEENWGFSKIYDPAYEFCQPSYFQSMAYIAFGATGLNIYTAAATDGWNERLDSQHTPPYPASPPIKEDGTIRQKFWTVYQIASFFKRNGTHLVKNDPQAPLAWGFYAPYSQAACWQQNQAEWKRAGFSGVCHSIAYGWDPFLRMLAKNDTDSGLAYLREDNLNDLLKFKIIFMNGFDWMDRRTQQKLARYVRRGGRLVLTGIVPYLDENMRPCRILQNAVFPASLEKINLSTPLTVNLDKNKFRLLILRSVFRTHLKPGCQPLAQAAHQGTTIDCGYIYPAGRGRGIYLGFIPWLTADNIWENEGLAEYLLDKFNLVSDFQAKNSALSPRVDVRQFADQDQRRQYIFILNRENFSGTHNIQYTDEKGAPQYFSCELCANTAAVIGIKAGKINSALLKCTNDQDNLYTQPRLVNGRQALGAGTACDLAFTKQGEYYEVTVTNIREKTGVEVMIPLKEDEVRMITCLDNVGERKVAFSGTGANIRFIADDLNDNFKRYRIYLKKMAKLRRRIRA